MEGTRFLLFCFIICVVQHTANAGYVVVDHSEDIAGAWDVSCTYINDYQDFWVYGCPTVPSEDIFPRNTGFWTACKKTCKMTYDGGILPKPAQLKVTTYIEGDATIEIGGKNKPSDVDYSTTFEKMTKQAKPGWCQQTFDLTKTDAKVLELTISAPRNGFVLMEELDIDIGAKELAPMELDTKSDELPAQWSDTCHYMDKHEEFWVWGCPVDLKSNNPIVGAQGYWTSCSLSSCKVDFGTSTSLVPSMANVLAYVDGSAKIILTIPGEKTDENAHPVPIVVKVISVAETGKEGWQDVSIDLTGYPSNYKLSAEIVGADDGFAVLDALKMQFASSGTELKPNTFAACQSAPPKDNGGVTVSTNLTCIFMLFISFAFLKLV